MPLRTVMLLTALALAGGWYLGTVAGPASSRTAGSGQPSGPRPIGVEGWAPAPPFNERLERRLANRPRSPRPTRNPFVFQSAPSRYIASNPAGGEQVPDANGSDAVTPMPRGPVYSLSGIAADKEGDETVWTAMVTDGAQLHFLSVGDSLPGGFTVVGITESTVTLADESGGQRTLELGK